MMIKEVMTPNPITVAPTTSVLEAARMMREYDLGSLPVSDRGNLTGFITDRDIVIRCVANESDPKQTQVHAVMSPEIICCAPESPASEALELMASRQVHRLPVVDEDKKLVGIVSIGMLADLGDEPKAVCETIREVRSPTTPAV